MRGDHQVEHPDLDSPFFEGRGEIGEPQRRGRGFGDGVKRVDQEDAHEIRSVFLERIGPIGPKKQVQYVLWDLLKTGA